MNEPKKETSHYENGEIEHEKYCLNGNLHREDGPAYINYYENGKVELERYCLNDKLHREDGPAIIKYYESGEVEYEEYWLNGKRHRENGPAITHYYKSGKKRYGYAEDCYRRDAPLQEKKHNSYNDQQGTPTVVP